MQCIVADLLGGLLGGGSDDESDTQTQVNVGGGGGLLSGGLLGGGGVLSNLGGVTNIAGNLGGITNLGGDLGGITSLTGDLGGLTSQVSNLGDGLSGVTNVLSSLEPTLISALGPSIASLSSQSSQIFQITKTISTITSSATDALGQITSLTTSITNVFTTVNQVATEASTGLGQSPLQLTSAIGGVQDATQSFIGNFNTGSPITQQIVGPSITQVYQSIQRFVQVTRTYTQTAYDQLSVDQGTAQQTVVHVTKIVVTLQTVVQVASTTITSLTTYERWDQNVQVTQTFTRIIQRIQAIVQSISTKSTSVVVIKQNLQSVSTGLQGIDTYFPSPGPIGILPAVAGVNLPVGGISLPVVGSINNIQLPISGIQSPINNIVQSTLPTVSNIVPSIVPSVVNTIPAATQVLQSPGPGPDNRSYLETRPGDTPDDEEDSDDDDNTPDDSPDYVESSPDDDVEIDDNDTTPIDSNDEDDTDDVGPGSFIQQPLPENTTPRRLYNRFQNSLSRIRHYVVKNIRQVTRNHRLYRSRILTRIRSILSLSDDLGRYLTELRPSDVPEVTRRTNQSFRQIRNTLDNLLSTFESLKPRLSRPQVKIINDLTQILTFTLNTSRRIVTNGVQRIGSGSPDQLTTIKIETLRSLINELDNIDLPNQQYITRKSRDINAPSFGDDETGPDDDEQYQRQGPDSFIARPRRRPIITGPSPSPIVEETISPVVDQPEIVTTSSPIVSTVVGGGDTVTQQTSSTAASSSTATSQTTTVVAPIVVAPTVVQETSSTSSATSTSSANTQSTTIVTPVIQPSPISVTSVETYPEQEQVVTPIITARRPESFATIRRPRIVRRPRRVYRPIVRPIVTPIVRPIFRPSVVISRPRRPITQVVQQTISSRPEVTVTTQSNTVQPTDTIVEQTIQPRRPIRYRQPRPTSYRSFPETTIDTTPDVTYPDIEEDNTPNTPSFVSIRPRPRRPIRRYRPISQPIIRRPILRPRRYPIINTSPVVTTPTIIDTSPTVIETSPTVIETTPTVIETSPTVIDTTSTIIPSQPIVSTSSATATATATTSTTTATASSTVVTGNIRPHSVYIFRDFVNSLNSAFTRILEEVSPFSQINTHPVINAVHRVHLSIHTVVLYISQLNVNIIDTVSSSSIIYDGFREVRLYLGRIVQVVQLVIDNQQIPQGGRIQLIRVIKHTSAIVAITVTEIKQLVQNIQYNNEDGLWNAIEVLLQRLISSYDRVFVGKYNGLADQDDYLGGLSFLQNNLVDSGDDQWSPVYRGLSQSTAQILDNSIVGIGQTIAVVSNEYDNQLNDIEQIIGNRDDGHPATQYLRQLANRLSRNNGRLNRVEQRLDAVLNVLRNLQVVGSNSIGIGGTGLDSTVETSSSASASSSTSSGLNWDGTGWRSSTSSASASASSRSTKVYTQALQFGDQLADNLYKYSGFPQVIY